MTDSDPSERSRNLLSLPPELIHLIVTHCSHPRDVLAFIKTCRYILDAFNGNKAPVLAKTIRNAFGHDLLCDAVTACEASRIRHLSPARDTPVQNPNRHQDLIAEYSKPYAARTLDLHDWTLLCLLYRLWWLCEYFLKEFREHAFGQMPKYIPKLDPDFENSPSLSGLEKRRLLRAFLRLEVFRRIMNSTYTASNNSTPDMQATTMVAEFVELFPPWEQDEIFSVQHFLICHIWISLRAMHSKIDTIVMKVLSTNPKCTKVLPLSIGTPAWDLAVRYYNLENHRIFHGLNAHEERCQHLVSRGLPFIRWFSKLPMEDQLRIMARHDCFRYDASVTETCLAGRVFDLRGIENRLDSGDSLAFPNEGWMWMWMQEHNGSSVEQKEVVHKSLRQVGYVFWDKNRILEAWKFRGTSIHEVFYAVCVEHEWRRRPVQHAAPKETWIYFHAAYNLTIREKLTPNEAIAEMFPSDRHLSNEETLDFEYEY